MLAHDLGEVLVESRKDLAHAVIELRSAVRHDQVASDGRKARLPEVIGQSQQGLVILIGNLGALDIHSLPLLAQNRLGKKGWGKEVRESKRSANRLDRLRLIARRARRQTTPGDVGGRVCRVVAQRLLRLIDVGET